MFDDEVGRDTTPEIAAGIAAARRSLNASQYGSIFSASVGIVVALRPISLTDTATSFTNPSVSGSVYCNILHEIPALIARDLLHEATHCWFNNYLAATGVALERSVPKFHSPWKQAARPAFGFAHSVISFSIVCLYLAGEVNMCKESDDYTARVLKVLLDRERERLASVCDDIDILAAEYPALEFLPRLTHEATSKQTI
ncbi:hypothetical protein ACIA8C_23000 [Nocardia sp. NPDC051321]|uniref:hypothetical protein n=1 Tax=Nocardia sp. NPDC051321 TaxID=3364323 RepID=UPI0037A5F048